MRICGRTIRKLISLGLASLEACRTSAHNDACSGVCYSLDWLRARAYSLTIATKKSTIHYVSWRYEFMVGNMTGDPLKMQHPVNVTSSENLRGFSGNGTGSTEKMSAEIRPCTRRDLASVAEIHKSRFDAPCSHLGQLSPPLIAAFYAAFIGHSIFLVHSSDGEVDGFILGGSSREILRCRLSFSRAHALACIAEIACRPNLWLLALRSIATLTRKWFVSMAGAPVSEELRLISIAVAAHATRRGVGTALVECFEAATRAACRTYSLNVLKSNSSALKFYEKLGFQVVGERAIALTLRKELAAHASVPEAPSA